ncbi:MAG: APC family permease [Terriglobales bacterium]|jgi:APA family basic amino acid/polyamine antiporter
MTSTQTGRVQTSAGQAGLLRAIGRWSLAALAVNSIIGSGIFGLPATVAALLGKQSVAAVLIAGAAMGVIMACFAEVASQFSEAGGPYVYARTAFGRLTGILVGWMLYLAQTAAPAANANLFVIYLAEFWPAAKAPWPRFGILTLLVGLLALINLRGARQGTAVSNVFTVAKILPLLMVISAGAALTIFHPAPWGAGGPMPASAWMKALVLLIFAYGGFESALAPMSEAKNPARDAAFALFVALIACTAIYALVQWVVVGVLGPGATTDRPLAEVARVTMGNRGAGLVAIGALVSVYGYLSAKLLGMPRVTFALAKGGDLPQVFAAVSSRFHTPWFSILFFAAAVWGLAIMGSFAWNVTLSVAARLFYYGVVCAALIALRRKQSLAAAPAGGFRLPGGPLLSVLGVGIAVALGAAAQISKQIDLSKSLILAATVGAAVLNWLWARRTMQAPK